MVILEDSLYSEDHLWVKVNDDKSALIGLSDYGQQMAGEITSLDLPAEDEEIAKDEEFGSIGSVKKALTLYAPVSGKVLEVNNDLLDQPSVVNDDPYEAGWFLRVSIHSPEELDELLSPDDYRDYVEEYGGEDEDEDEDYDDDLEDYDQ